MGRCFSVAAAILMLVWHCPAGSDGPKENRQALQALQDFIGGWKGNGASADKSKRDIWKENVSWSWRFKGDNAWLSLEFSESKFFKSGEVRYLADKKVYQLTLTDKKGGKQVYEGNLTKKKDKFIVERVDPETKDTHQIAMNLAGSGIRSVYAYSIKPENRTIYAKQWQADFTKEGASFATAKKQIECVVTGGLGTIPVSYMGITYYVCCTGCRDAFNDNPEKIIKEYLAKKKAGK